MAVSTSAQFWENANPPSSLAEARICFNDTVHDWLIAGGGSNIYLDSLHAYYPLYRYNGFAWDTLGLFGNVVNAAVLYHDTLIVGGGFEWMQQNTIKRIACYVDGQWNPYGDLNSGAQGGGYVRGFRIVDGELYALGVFKYADGQLCNGAAKRVGGQWEPLPNWPTNFMGDPYMGDIIRFQGKLVACGNFHTLDNALMDVIQYDGNAWVPVCESCMHGGMDGAGALAVFQGYLYLGGRYVFSGGNAGQGLMRWDGETWEAVGPVGEGVQLDNYSDTYPPSIYSMQVRDGRLFFNGELGFVNHIPTPGVASWDGTQFCALGGANIVNGAQATSFGFYHDSLFMAHSNGVVLYNLLRYLSTDFAYQCSTLGVGEAVTVEEGFRAAWDASGELVLHGLSDGPHAVRVYDAQGRMVLDERVRSQGGSTGGLAFAGPCTALYVAVVDGQRAGRFIPMH